MRTSLIGPDRPNRALGGMPVCPTTNCCPPETPRSWSNLARASTASSTGKSWRSTQRLNEAKIDGQYRRHRRNRADLPLAHGLLRPARAFPWRAHSAHRRIDEELAAGRAGRARVAPAGLLRRARLRPISTRSPRRTNLTPAQVVERHSAVAYHVYMLGFLPGQAYMGDLPAELNLPRRETPRLKIPAGSLAIAMNMTCIFPLESPCGWHLIGRSPDSPVAGSARAAARCSLPAIRSASSRYRSREYEDLAAEAADGDPQDRAARRRHRRRRHDARRCASSRPVC